MRPVRPVSPQTPSSLPQRTAQKRQLIQKCAVASYVALRKRPCGEEARLAKAPSAMRAAFVGRLADAVLANLLKKASPTLIANTLYLLLMLREARSSSITANTVG